MGLRMEMRVVGRGVRFRIGEGGWGSWFPEVGLELEVFLGEFFFRVYDPVVEAIQRRGGGWSVPLGLFSILRRTGKGAATFHHLRGSRLSVTCYYIFWIFWEILKSSKSITF